MIYRVKLNYYYFDFDNPNIALNFMTVAKDHYNDMDGDRDFRVTMEIVEAPTAATDEAPEESATN